jgi:hypothetical protein
VRKENLLKMLLENPVPGMIFPNLKCDTQFSNLTPKKKEVCEDSSISYVSKLSITIEPAIISAHPFN